MPIVDAPSQENSVRRNQRERNRDVLLEAWRIRRKAAVQYACPVKQIDFSECMKMAWELIKVTEEPLNVWKFINCKPRASRVVRQSKIRAALNEWHPDRFYGATKRVLEFSNRVTRELISLRNAA